MAQLDKSFSIVHCIRQKERSITVDGDKLTTSGKISLATIQENYVPEKIILYSRERVSDEVFKGVDENSWN